MENRYSYVLKQNTKEKQETRRYHENDLLLMTVFQLREICRQENLMRFLWKCQN